MRSKFLLFIALISMIGAEEIPDRIVNGQYQRKELIEILSSDSLSSIANVKAEHIDFYTASDEDLIQFTQKRSKLSNDNEFPLYTYGVYWLYRNPKELSWLLREIANDKTLIEGYSAKGKFCLLVSLLMIHEEIYSVMAPDQVMKFSIAVTFDTSENYRTYQGGTYVNALESRKIIEAKSGANTDCFFSESELDPLIFLLSKQLLSKINHTRDLWTSPEVSGQRKKE